MWWPCWIMTISTSKFAVVMVLVTWRQPKLTNNYRKWQKILLCKKLMNEEWKVIVLTPFSSHKCASRRKQNITFWPMPLASLPSYIYRPMLFPSSHHYLRLCLPPFPSPQKAPWMSFMIFFGIISNPYASIWTDFPILVWQPMWHYSVNTQKPPLPLNTICASIGKPCHEMKYIMQ